MKTKAFLLEGIKKYSWKEKELILGDNDVLVKICQSSICGTDKNFFLGDLPPKKKYPFFIGHEGGGIVEQVGKNVNKFSTGDNVISFHMNCTFAKYSVANENFLHKTPKNMDFEIFSLGEPIACAMFSGMTSEVNLGDNVAVFGMGFAGQIISQVVKLKGANQVISLDISDEKLKLAKDLGADKTINFNTMDVEKEINNLTDGKGVDVAIECAGTEESMNMCSKVLKHDGTLVLYSWIIKPICINISRWHDDGFKILNTCLMHHTDCERINWTDWALSPVEKGLIKIKPLISHVFKLNEIDKAFDVALNDPSAIKVCLRP